MQHQTKEYGFDKVLSWKFLVQSVR